MQHEKGRQKGNISTERYINGEGKKQHPDPYIQLSDPEILFAQQELWYRIKSMEGQSLRACHFFFHSYSLGTANML